MMLRQPKFWTTAHHPLSWLLMPLSWVWAGAAKLRALIGKSYTSNVKVICIGNIAVGGSGKTPAAIAIAAHLKNQNKKVVFLTRGYGGTSRNPILISNANDAKLYGDEAVLLSRHAPTIVAANRVSGLKIAEQQGFDVVIADDGFQNPSFTKNVSIVVIDGTLGFSNGRIMPAGPLRESVASAAARAHAVLIVGDDKTNAASLFPTLPVLHGAIEVMPGAPDTAVPYVAFAGIGHPDKFFNTLGDQGYVLAETVSFPDHHAYSDADIDRLQRLSARHNARLITTEKDYMRLLPLPQANIAFLPVTMTISGDLDGLLK